MPRPPKERNLCPRVNGGFFDSGSDAPPVELAPDELEAMRLADLEELDQQSAAFRMGISRGTFQRLLYSAHRKVAFALVGRHSIRLEAPLPGKVPCNPACRADNRGCRFCEKKFHPLKIKGDEKMRIAVTSENGQVFQHFGHTPEFTIFEVADGKLNGMRKVGTGETEHGALAGMLKELGADVLLCGGIGGGAQMALAEQGIKLVGGVSGDVIDAAGDYLKGTLQANPDFSCHHHDHADGHSCGGHGHGEGHSCGGNCHA